MPRHLQREIDNLKKKILQLSAVVEENVRNAVRSVEQRDLTLAKKITEIDNEVDQMEVDLEEDGLKILALHQPVAIDLRFIIAVLKINSDLERIGDLAVNIAERGVFLASQPKIELPSDILVMATNAQSMLRKSLDSLVNLDPELAREVCTADDDIDSMLAFVFDKVQDRIRKRPEDMECLIQLLSISRYLERIADHATNIAEDVIYMAEGYIARHRADFGKKPTKPDASD
jgi:phosphate transport system protein